MLSTFSVGGSPVPQADQHPISWHSLTLPTPLRAAFLSCISVRMSKVGLFATKPPSINLPAALKYVRAAPLLLAALQTVCWSGFLTGDIVGRRDSLTPRMSIGEV